MSEKLKEVNQARSSVEAGFKTVERQAENQYQKLHLTEIDLATQRQLVLDLKAELQRAKVTLQLAKEAAEVEKQASYQLGVEEMQIRLTEELSEVCKDYCNVTWERALSIAGVPVDFFWRQPGSVYYHPDIREVPGAVSSPPTPVPEILSSHLLSKMLFLSPRLLSYPAKLVIKAKGPG